MVLSLSSAGALTLYPNGRAFLSAAREWRARNVAALELEERLTISTEASLMALEDRQADVFSDVVKLMKAAFGGSEVTGPWLQKLQLCERKFTMKALDVVASILEPAVNQVQNDVNDLQEWSKHSASRSHLMAWLHPDIVSAACMHENVTGAILKARDLVLILEELPTAATAEGSDHPLGKRIHTILTIEGDQEFGQIFGPVLVKQLCIGWLFQKTTIFI